MATMLDESRWDDDYDRNWSDYDYIRLEKELKWDREMAFSGEWDVEEEVEKY